MRCATSSAYSRNAFGPRTDHCGTPKWRAEFSESLPSATCSDDLTLTTKVVSQPIEGLLRHRRIRRKMWGPPRREKRWSQNLPLLYAYYHVNFCRITTQMIWRHVWGQKLEPKLHSMRISSPRRKTQKLIVFINIFRRQFFELSCWQTNQRRQNITSLGG